MGSPLPGRFRVRKIAVIGAGPVGLCAARYLRAQGSFESIVIFEQQEEIGGVWNYNRAVPGPYPVPQLDPQLPPDPPEIPEGSPSQAPVVPSAMYDKLHTNIPSSLMEFSDQRFPEDAWAFPKRETVQEYLLKYALDVRGLIKFCFRVNRVSLVQQDDRDRWDVEAQSTAGGEALEETFDAVVVANGHYATPFIPDIGNIKAFHDAHPSIISHSKHYRSPGLFAGKKVIVVGNGPSGIDIALQINGVCRQPALLSVKQATNPERLAHTGCKEVAEIVEFTPQDRGVRFADGSVETGIDAIVFCTGFLFSYPFLQPEVRAKLIRTGKGVHGLYKHLFFSQHPTMVFPGLNMKSVPWPLSEAQAAVFSSVWSNNLELPALEEMERWGTELLERKGEALHICEPLEDGKYINELHGWAKQSGHLGKEPPWWDEEKFWERRIFADAKLRFEQTGCKATSLAELGLCYQPEKEEE